MHVHTHMLMCNADLAWYETESLECAIHYSLLTTHYSLLTTHYSLLTTDY